MIAALLLQIALATPPVKEVKGLTFRSFAFALDHPPLLDTSSGNMGRCWDFAYVYGGSCVLDGELVNDEMWLTAGKELPRELADRLYECPGVSSVKVFTDGRIRLRKYAWWNWDDVWSGPGPLSRGYDSQYRRPVRFVIMDWLEGE